LFPAAFALLRPLGRRIGQFRADSSSCLILFDAFDDVLVQPFMPDRAVVTLDTGVPVSRVPELLPWNWKQSLIAKAA